LTNDHANKRTGPTSENLLNSSFFFFSPIHYFLPFNFSLLTTG
jgi:hypothetical protein